MPQRMYRQKLLLFCLSHESSSLC